MRGLGKGGAKRHRKMLRDNVQGITKPAVRRLARRGGVKRISGLVYEETRGVLKAFMEDVIRDAVTYTDHAKRKTVTALDVVYALKRQGRPLYGFGESAAPPPRPKKPQATGQRIAVMAATEKHETPTISAVKDLVLRKRADAVGWMESNYADVFSTLLAPPTQSLDSQFSISRIDQDSIATQIPAAFDRRLFLLHLLLTVRPQSYNQIHDTKRLFSEKLRVGALKAYLAHFGPQKGARPKSVFPGMKPRARSTCSPRSRAGSRTPT